MNAIIEARYNLAIAYLNDSQYSEAIPEFEAVTQLDADFIDAHCGLSRAYLELNELEKAEISAKTAISLNSDNPSALSLIDSIKNAHYDNGIASLNNLRYNEAVSSLLKVEDIDPDYKNVGYNLGRAYIGLKEYDKAINSLQHALSTNPEQDGIHFNLGHAYVEQRQFDNAIQHLEKAIISDPNKIDAHYNLARAYRELGNLEAATNAASETLRLDPNFQPIHDLVESIKQTHYNKGITYLNDERYSDAVASFHNVIALDSDFTPVNYNLGIAYLKMENYPRAIDVLQKAVKLDTNHKSAFHALALAFFGQHELENARNAAKEALRIDPTYKPAKSLLEAIDPSFLNIHIPSTTDINETTQTTESNNINDQQVKKDNKVETTDDKTIQTEVDKDADNSTDVEKDLIRGSVFLKNKQYNQAAAAFKRVIKADPNSVEAFYGLGQVYLEIAAYDDAETAANDVLKLNPKHHPSLELLQVIKYVRNYERKKKLRKKVFIYASIVLIIAFSTFAAIRFGLIPDPDPPSPKLTINVSLEGTERKNTIYAGETGKLVLNIKNSGGPIDNLGIDIESTEKSELEFTIPKQTYELNTGDAKKVEIAIKAQKDVGPKTVPLKLRLIDKHKNQITSESFNLEIKLRPDTVEID